MYVDVNVSVYQTSPGYMWKKKQMPKINGQMRMNQLSNGEKRQTKSKIS